MGPGKQAGDWRTKLLVGGVVGLICAGLYPTVVVPLQIAYGGRPRPERDPDLKPGFEKKSMWGVSELEPELLAKARKLALGVGAAAGAFGSLVGVGGGVLIGPVILNTCPSVPQRVISGTSLAAVAATGATAGAVYWSSDCVDSRSALILAATAIITAPLGAKMTHKVDCQRLRKALGYWLYLVAPLVPLKAMLFADKQQQSQQPQANSTALTTQQQQGQQQSQQLQSQSHLEQQQVHADTVVRAVEEQTQQQQGRLGSDAQSAALAATGCLAGFASGMLGIGGGTVVTPLLALITQAPQQTVLGTSLAAMVMPSLIGLAQHQRLGNVDWRMAGALAVGTSIGSYVGSNFAVSAPAGVLEGLFAAGMLLLGRRTLVAAAKAVPKSAQ